MTKTETDQGPVRAIPTPFDPVRMEFEVMEDRIAALRERITVLEEMMRALVLQLPEAGRGGGRPVIAGFIWGPVISAPDSQSVKVCNWDAVLVIVSRPDWFGPGSKPVVGATVTFSISGTTSGSTLAISSGPGGTGTKVGPGASVSVRTNASGEATIYIHDGARGTTRLKADTGGAWSQDIVINFV